MRQSNLAVICFLGALVPLGAHAHFKLVSPASWAAQNGLGDPQKSGPCGQSDPGLPASPTGIVTTVEQGQLLTVTFDETIFHPGHYRVSLAADQASLPQDPVVTPGTTACGSTAIVQNPTPPLLADGVLVHSAQLSGRQSVQVQLPPEMTCTTCVLQISQFMSNHGLNNPGGCFYHHCANLKIVAKDGGALDSGVATDSGTAAEDGGATDSGAPNEDAGALDAGAQTQDSGISDSGTQAFDAGATGGSSDRTAGSGCGCTTAQVSPLFGIFAIGALGALARARHRARLSSGR
jgi:hypothetical protein